VPFCYDQAKIKQGVFSGSHQKQQEIKTSLSCYRNKTKPAPPVPFQAEDRGAGTQKPL
jgi:hypothetical protein